MSLETTTTLVSSRQACKTIRVSASSWLNSKTSTASFLEIYKVDSVKSGTRYKRGEPTKRIHIRSWDQKMVKGKDWQSFFNSIENKNDLIDITGSCLRHETGRQKVTGNVVFVMKRIQPKHNNIKYRNIYLQNQVVQSTRNYAIP